MNTDHDELDDEYEEDEAPRSIFSAVWFRVVLVVLALGVVGAVAIPYVLDVVSTPPTATARATSPPVPEGAGARAVATLAEPAKPIAPTPVAPPKPPTPATPMTPSPSSATATPAEPAKRPEPERAKTVEPARPAPSASAAESAKPVERPRAIEPAKRAERVKVAESAKPADDPNAFPAARRSIPRADRVAAARPSASDGGEYFVQVGAFKDEATAKRVASRLRDGNYPVTESAKRASGASAEPPRTATRPAMATDRYDVIVSGGAATDINSKLAAKGLASEPAGDGVRIRPSLPLRDAVALSKDLGNEGFKVQVRRGGASGESTTPAPSTTAAGSTIYRVRVGGYADRDAAQVVMRELRDKGFDAFIARGRD